MPQRLLTLWNYTRLKDDGVFKLDFFHTAADELPFHEQWYRRYGDPDVSGHLELPLCFDPSMTCAQYRGTYVKNEKWL